LFCLVIRETHYSRAPLICKEMGQYPVSYTVLFDPEGVTASSWGIPAMPSSFLVNPRGEIVKQWAGFHPSHIEEIEDEIRSLIE